MSDWDTPLPFIICENDKFQLNAETVEKLLEIKKPLVSICIAGSYRTGKSYLMNRLIGQSMGFEIGNTVEPQTIGIWVWYKNHPKDKNKGLLVMDAEGLDSAIKDDEAYDMKILSLSIMLSSCFIYNIVGKIDTNLIDKLHFVTEISQHIRSKNNVKNAETTENIENAEKPQDVEDDRDDYNFDTFFPHFVLVCRDAILQLKMNGEDITADEYMERLMLTANKEAVSKREKERNQIKLKLRRYFPKRKCFFFVRPTSSEEDMLRLEQLKEDNLNPQFKNACTEFRNYLISHSSVKKVTPTQPMTGQILVHLSKIYVDAINDKLIPCIGSAVDLVASTENTKLIQECISKYIEFMDGLKYPLNNDELESAHSENHAIVVKYFAENIFLDESKEYHAKLQVELQKEYKKFAEINYVTSDKFCKSILHDLFEPIQQKIEKGGYFKIGGYKQLLKDSEKLQQNYNAVPNKGVMEKVILKKFLSKLQRDQENILQADNLLLDNQRKIEKETLLREEAQRNMEIEEEKLKQEKIYQQALIKDHQEQIRALSIANEEKAKEQKIYFDELIANRVNEQERLMTENFKEEAIRLKQETEALRAEWERKKK